MNGSGSSLKWVMTYWPLLTALALGLIGWGTLNARVNYLDVQRVLDKSNVESQRTADMNQLERRLSRMEDKLDRLVEREVSK
jgi:hypothetical protein